MVTLRKNLSAEKQYGIQKITNFWLINMMLLLLSVGDCIDIVYKLALFGHQLSLFILMRSATVH